MGLTVARDHNEQPRRSSRSKSTERTWTPISDADSESPTAESAFGLGLSELVTSEHGDFGCPCDRRVVGEVPISQHVEQRFGEL